jgi:outer membrane protein OmpA-like peptidoglycan-associated protein
MNATRQIVSLGLIAGLLAGTASAHAGDVVMFEGPAPQAAQLARILWPNKHGTTGETGATRSIRISPEVGQSNPALHPAAVEMEAAEPAPGTGTASGDAFAFQIRFAYDSTEILPESRSYLDSVGAMLRLPEAQGRKVTIVGHADAKGSEQYNQVLSERRAKAVRAYLLSEFRIAPDLLQVMGEGESDPLAGSDPYAARNRRVEFHAAG